MTLKGQARPKLPNGGSWAHTAGAAVDKEEQFQVDPELCGGLSPREAVQSSDASPWPRAKPPPSPAALHTNVCLFSSVLHKAARVTYRNGRLCQSPTRPSAHGATAVQLASRSSHGRCCPEHSSQGFFGHLRVWQVTSSQVPWTPKVGEVIHSWPFTACDGT